MRHRRSALSLVALATAAITVAAQPALAAGNGATVDRGTLTELNDSGVSGRITLVKHGDTLRVNLNVHGLEPGMLHVHHIHGFGDGGNATCPDASAADDIEDDGILSFAEGLPFYGPVLIVLGADTPDGATLAYSRTFDETGAGSSISSLGDLDQYTVVVHGLTIPGADGPVYDASTPVACAVLTDNGN